MTQRAVHMIGNAHIDPVWLWCAPEGRAEVRATFREALRHLDEYPEFVFTQNQIVFLQWVAETDPGLFERIRFYVASGRWQVAGGWWVEPDTNIPIGESLVRQGLYGQRFLAEHFGVRTDVGLCEDSFGHPASLPQLLSGVGLRYFAFMRPGPQEITLPKGAFNWRGPDGASVIAYRIPDAYGTSRWDLPAHLNRALSQLPDQGNVAVFYGVGNHGGGPTRANPEAIRRLRTYTGMPPLACSTLGRFFAAASVGSLPAVLGDLHQHAVGCYSTHGAVKRWMRRAERRLLQAERWATLAHGVTGLPYPAAALRDAWHVTLLNQFHDTLGGTAVPEAYADVRDQLGFAATIADRTTDRSLQSIAGQVAIPFVEGTQCYLVFNSLPARRALTAEINYVPSHAGPVRVEDADTGQVIAAQATPASSTVVGWQRRILVDVDVGGLGYRTLRFVPDQDGTGLADRARDLRPGEDAVLDNGLVHLRVDRVTGRPVELALAGGPNLLGPGPHALSVPDVSDTWGHGIRRFRATATEFVLERIRVMEAGPVRHVLRVQSSLDRNRLQEDYLLTAGARHVDVRTRLDWATPHAVCKLRYPTRIAAGPARWDCAYGSVERPANGEEQPLHAWIQLPGLGIGVDGLSAADVATSPGGTADVGLTVTRSPLYAWHDPAPAGAAHSPRYVGLGAHEFTVRLVPLPRGCTGPPVHAALVAAASSLSAPALIMREGAHPGRLPLRASFASVEAGTARLAVIKPPEDAAQDGTVIRVFETSGAPADTTIRLRERPITLRLGGHELRTLLVPANPTDEPVTLDLCEWTDPTRPAVQPVPKAGP